MGFNVDVAPANSSVDDLALQCVENDADILLVLGANHMTIPELTNLANKLAFYELETVKALFFQTPLSLIDSKKLEDLYRIFPEGSNPIETSLGLLKVLLTNA
jgi:methylmalonyl-CoA mutase cobalamin-binding subunit